MAQEKNQFINHKQQFTMANFRCKMYAALFVCCISTLGVTAQENLKRAIRAFTEQKDGIEFNNSLSETKDPMTGKLVFQKNIYEFKMDVSKMRLLNDIRNAFDVDKSMGYNFMCEIAPTGGQDTKNGANEGNPNDFMAIDSKTNTIITMNLYNLRKKTQDDKPAPDKTTHISYGDNPEDYIVINDKEGYNTIMMNVIDKGNTAYRYNYTMEWSQPKSNASSEKYISGRILVIYSKKPDQNTTEVENPKVEMLTKFNVMKNRYNGDDETLSATIAASMVELCKNNAGLLSKSEKNLFISSLQEMQKKTKDKFQKGLLEEAISYLK